MRLHRRALRAVAIATVSVLALLGGNSALAERVPAIGAQQALPTQPGAWKSLGPQLLDTNKTDTETLATGRVLSLAYGGGVLFAGSAGGGVWTSADSGQTWTPRTDNSLNSNIIGALAVDPSNPKIVFAGTGDLGQIDQPGDGIYRSTDGGVTWTHVTGDAFAQSAIAKIVIDPTNGRRVYAGVVSENPNAGDLGVMVSSDGGATWSESSLKDTKGNIPNVTDMAIDAHGGVYAAVGGAGTPNDLNAGSGVANGIWYSSDGGGNWTQVSNGLPSQSADCVNSFDKCGGYYKLALGPGTAGSAQGQQTLYAGVSYSTGDNPGLLGIYRTTDGGADWTDITANLESTDPCNYLDGNSNQAIGNLVLQPGDGNSLYLGRVDIFKADDASADAPNWHNISHVYGRDNVDTTPTGASCPDVTLGAVHADQHAMLVVPGIGAGGASRIYFANDGGVYYSDDAGATYSSANGNAPSALAAVQFYNGSISADGNRILAGSQDNGTLLGTRDPATGVYNWKELLGGDGGDSIIDPGNANVLYAENPNGELVKATDGGATQDSWNPVCPVPKKAGDCSKQTEKSVFITPLAMDPKDSKTLYLGLTHLWRTTDGAAHWNAIGPDNTGSPLTAVAISPTNPNVVYAGNEDGHVWVTTNAKASDAGQVTWTLLDTANCASAGPNCPKQTITGMAVDPSDANGKTVYVTVDGYGAGNHVYRSANGGQTWTDISAGLPAIPFYSVAVGANGTIYAGAVRGAYTSSDGGKTWSILGTGLPNVWVQGLVVSGTTVYAFTYGRGLWEIGASAPPPAKPALTITGSYVAHIKGQNDIETKSIKLKEKADFVVAYTLANGQGITPTATLTLTYKGKVAGTYPMDAVQFTDGTVGFAKARAISSKTRLGKWTAQFTVTAGSQTATQSVSFSLKK